MNSSKLGKLAGTLALAWAVAGPSAHAASAAPANLGAGLRPLVAVQLADPEAARERLAAMPRITLDERGRVMVDIYADGRIGVEALRGSVEALDVSVRTVYTGYRHGVLTAFVPLARAAELARLAGVSSVVLVHKPVTHVGDTTSQGTVVLRSDLVNDAGISGEGLTVGVMSDSYNRATRAKTSASDDVASGDLPDLTNSNARSPGVKFLIEGPLGSTDEGRAMAQIVYDVAPGVELCFATAYSSETDFANNIRELRTNPACNADVIVDDIIYLAEPMFSDGIIAQAVDEVVTSTTLAGKPVLYFSSAGNRGAGYSSKFRRVDAAVAADLPDLPVNLASIPGSVDTSGGFQDFDPGEAIDIAQKITCSGGDCTVVFQWDDPFDVPGGVTTDFNFLVFDSAGNYVAELSITDDNFATSQPLEISATDLVADTSYQIVVARTGSGGKAKYLKYVTFGGSLLAEHNERKGYDASTYGHNSARHGNGVAAYIYDDVPLDTPPYDGYTPSLEGYSSPGPVKILFDAAGNRLASVETREKPDLAAPDGVNTTFFPSGQLSSTDYEGDGFPNFFGTSAAAPHAAGVAALLLDKAGGPGSLGADAVRSALQSTAPERDKDPTYAAATLRDDISGEVLGRISGTGTGSADPDFFRVELPGAGLELSTLTIDLTPAGLQFDPSADVGFPLTVGSSTGPVITSPLPTAPTQVLTLDFSGFTSGNVLTFGIDRDIAALAGYGNSADLLGDAKVTGTVNGYTGTLSFFNRSGTGYIYEDGYGLIDAKAAVDATP